MIDFSTFTTNQLLILAVAAIWTLVWKGIGLWHSAQNKQKGWFIAFIIINSLGILPIIYINWFQKKK